MSITYDAKTCQDYEASAQLEWLCTNGLGGYASGSVSGANTRKYHGYLVVAARPPVDRFVMLSRVEDRITIGEHTYDLSTDEFPDVVHPQGYLSLQSFTQAAGPTWRFELAGSIIEKTIHLVQGENTVIVRYKLISSPSNKPAQLTVQPMFAGRDFHHTIQAQYRPTWQSQIDSEDPKVLRLTVAECPVSLAITHNAAHFSSHPCWWYNFIFRQERTRGYPDRDDLWTPGTLMFDLKLGETVGFICSTKPVPFAQQAQLVAAEEARFTKLHHAFAQIDPKDELLAELSVAADQFVVRRGVTGAAGSREMSVIAGYPWFEDWGRDTFISLPGLTLVTGRFDAARSILATFADHLRRGLLPNRFPDKATTPEYHTVDASMWFVHAAYQYWRYSGDGKFLATYLYRPLCEIMDAYRNGTDFGIRMDSDGLIRAGQPQVQLTWMDAKVGDWVVTPRHGKPVEINALWYNNLRIMALVAELANDPQRSNDFATLAQQVAETFTNAFWNKASECLYDVVDDNGGKDPAIRPNQLLATSLPFSPLEMALQKKIIKTTQQHLLTPMGMRTLAPGSLGYHGRCAGDQLARDMAYHQGTVWPWLIGPFISGYVRTHQNTPEARAQARLFLVPFAEHLHKAGISSISEIADGDAPHSPRGCIAQAWSVAEVLRAYYEDVLDRAPAWPHERKSELASV